jgi:hypothetical protein
LRFLLSASKMSKRGKFTAPFPNGSYARYFAVCVVVVSYAG